MEWWDVIIKVLGLLSPIFTFLIGLIFSKYKDEKKRKEEQSRISEKEYTAMKETCKLALRKSLKDDYQFFTAQGWCSIDDKHDVESEYTLYHEEFNGNGRGTRYYNAIMALPDEKPKK